MYMNYVNAWREKDADVIQVVERDDNRRRRYKTYPIDYTFYAEDARGKYQSIFGHKLSKITCRNRTEFQKEIKLNSNRKLFETDLNPIFTCLAQNYLNKDAPKLNVAFFDIETDMQPFAYPSTHVVKLRDRTITVFELSQLENKESTEVYDHVEGRWVKVRDSRYLDIGPGYASPNDATMPVTAVSLYFQWMDTLVCLALVPATYTRKQAEELVKDIPGTILFDNEKDLLDTFLNLIDDVDVLSAWNGEGFDIPYMVNRITRVLSKDDTRRFCLWNQYPSKRIFEKYGREVTTYDLIGRMHIDCLDLYRKYTYEERHSYRLDAIAEHELGDHKIAYEGTLDQLYYKDFKKFVEYNIQDCELLYRLERKLKFIDLTNAIAHENTVLLSTTMGTVAATDQAIINEAHRLNMIVPSKKHSKDQDTNAAGAYVAYPKKGLHDWIGSLDINSLYPSIIRALNMGPETIVGQLRPTMTEEYIQAKMAQGSSFAGAWEGLFGSLEYTAVMNQEKSTILMVDWTNNKPAEYSAAEIYDIIFNSNRKWVLSANGTIFSYDKEAVIPGLLSSWYSERKSMQQTKKQWDMLDIGIVIPDRLIGKVEHDNK